MKIMFLLLLLLYQLQFLHGEEQKWPYVVCIDGSTGNASSYDTDSATCNSTYTNTRLSQSLFDGLLNGTLLYIRTSTLTINESLYLSFKDKIGLHSMLNNTAITCESIPQVNHTGYGIRFVRVSSLSLRGLSFHHCGALQSSTSANASTPNHPQLFRSALYLLNCTDVDLNCVSIVSSIGTGLALFDCNGTVSITNCEFKDNGVSKNESFSGGNGVYIEFTYCSPDWFALCTSDEAAQRTNNMNSHYSIRESRFIGNNASRFTANSHLKMNNVGKIFRGIGKGGGGLSVFLRGNARHNVFRLENLNFTSNNARDYGGALYLQFQDSSNNTVFLSKSHFYDNSAEQSGGAINVGFYFPMRTRGNLPRNNSIQISSTLFKRNSAEVGGGVLLFSSSRDEYLENSFKFTECIWRENVAMSGSAVMCSIIEYLPTTNSILPEPCFIDCLFEYNHIKQSLMEFKYDQPALEQTQRGSGTIYMKLFTLHFGGNTIFRHNNGTAIYAVNSIIKLANETDITFFGNRGNYGGAIALVGLSSIQVGINVSFNFTSNNALNDGGAINDYSIDKISSHQFGLCFIEYTYPPQCGSDEGKATFVFEDNHSMKNFGNSIYASTLQPCSLLCCSSSLIKQSPEEIFKCIGISFNDSMFSHHVATEGTSFDSENNTSIYYIPGKAFKLPVVMVDEVGSRLETVPLRGMIVKKDKNDGDTCRLEHLYTYNYHFTLYGRPESNVTLAVGTYFFRNISFKMELTLSNCPPGFNYDNGTCKCSISNSSWSYIGIFACDNTEFFALAYMGYWVGYIPVNDTRPESLITTTCPLGYCDTGNRTEIHLPSNPSSVELDVIMCRSRNRTGIICGSCIEGHSVYYHSYTYSCGPDTYCHLGVLFYILSEILPLTIIFTIVIMFRLNFTSGYLNGYVLFAQMLDSLSLEANGAVLIEQENQKRALEILHILYSPFNFDFFTIEPLSFCLFKGWNFLQVTSFKFLTLTIALLLVIILVVIMRCSCCYKIQLLCFKSKITNSASLIQGLSAFLVLSYGLCCQACYKILNIALPNGMGHRGHAARVFRMGDFEYLSNEHLPFALLAMFFFIAMVVGPMLFLLLQPLGYKFLPERVLNYAKTRWVFKRIELASPFLDTFQGCFKDQYRSFAGLYLMYRSVASGTFALCNSRFEVYLATEVILVFMLALHAWVQPYKKKIHNHIDTGIFLIMIIVNTLTMYRFHETQVQTRSTSLEIVTDFQLFLVYVPAACLAVALIFYAVYGCLDLLKKRGYWRNNDEDDTLPDLLDSREIRTRRWTLRRPSFTSPSSKKPEQLVLKYDSLTDFSCEKSTIRINTTPSGK